MDNPNLMRVTDVIEITGKAKATVYRWVHSGKVKATWIGNELFIYRDSLREFLGPEAVKVGIKV